MERLSRIVRGEADEEAAAEFRDQWHGRVQRILDAPAEGGPFAVERVD